MKYIYLSRNSNRSGYYVLKYLLENSKYRPLYVLLPKGYSNPIDDLVFANEEKERYLRECQYYGCKPLRFLNSVRLLADKHSVKVIELSSLKDDSAYQWVEQLALDLIVLGGGWPELLPQEMINLPKLGAINTHPSLLPNYRGADVHRWQVYHGESYSGCTIHYVDANFDTGDIIAQESVAIKPWSSPQELFEKVSKLAGPLMNGVLNIIHASAPERVKTKRQSNKNKKDHYFPKWDWTDLSFLKINWTDSPKKIAQLVLACTQESYKYNGPYFNYGNEKIIVRKASVKKIQNNVGLPGQVIDYNDESVLVACGDKYTSLSIEQVQPTYDNEWLSHSHSAPAVCASIYFLEKNIKPSEVLT